MDECRRSQPTLQRVVLRYWRGTYRAEIQAFADCIQQDGTPKVTLEDGYKSVEWAAKATEAVKDGKVVTMN